MLSRPNIQKLIKALTAVLAVIAVFATEGCSAGASSKNTAALSGGSVIEKKARFEHLCCGNDKGAVNTVIYVDASATSTGRALTHERIAAIAAASRVTAIHGGHLRVTLFSRSISDTQPVIDEDLNPGSGTPISKILHADKDIGGIVATVAPALQKPTITPDGTDVLATLVDAAQTRSQLPPGQTFRVLLITDGENSIGTDLTKGLTTSKATALANSVPVPNLTGATVTITGLGLVGGGSQPLSHYTAALTDFWQIVCDRSTGSTCSPPTTHYVA